MTRAQPQAEHPRPPSAVELANVFLAAAVSRRVLSVVIEPGPVSDDVVLETVAGPARALSLPAELGSAVIARVALVAGLDVAASLEQLGRIVVAAGEHRTALMVMTYRRARGLGLELRRLVELADLDPGLSDPAVPAGDPGDMVGSYRLEQKLGAGGNGVVYQAVHAALGKRVAIKILHAHVARDPRRAAGLLREGRLASRAQSPGIVDVIDFGRTDDGRTYLVMELVGWPTLRRLLADGALEPRRAVAIARQILVALEAAHHEGVVHRDLKPENIFVGPGDAVKIGDFGSARALEGPPGPGAASIVSGSPEYMSPEQCMGQTTDRRSDIYGVGCTLFEMLTGRVPFPGDTTNEVMICHVQDPIPAPVSPHGQLPHVLVAAVGRALEKLREDRQQSASEMIADLDACAAELGRTGWQRWLP